MEHASVLLKPRPLKAPLIASGIWLSNPTVHCSRLRSRGGEGGVCVGELGGGRGGEGVELEADGVKLLLAEALTVLCTE